MTANPDAHELKIVTDEQRRRGWHLAYRCASKGCDTRGHVTVPRRETAVELLGMLAAGHLATEEAHRDR